MLILSRRAGESVVLDGDVRIIVLGVDRRGVRLGIEAPRGTRIRREELTALIAAENQRAVTPSDAAWVARLLPAGSDARLVDPNAAEDRVTLVAPADGLPGGGGQKSVTGQ